MNKIIKIILTILTPIIQISFFSTQNILTHLNLILCLSALLLFFNSRFLIYFIIITGVILDIYSILPFPFTTMSLLLTIFFLNLLFKNLLTNRSLYSLILLGIIGTIAYNSILSILTYFAYLFQLYIPLKSVEFLKLTVEDFFLGDIYYSQQHAHEKILHKAR